MAQAKESMAREVREELGARGGGEAAGEVERGDEGAVTLGGLGMVAGPLVGRFWSST